MSPAGESSPKLHESVILARFSQLTIDPLKSVGLSNPSLETTERFMFRIPKTLIVLVACASVALASIVHAQTKKPNIVVIWGDDIGVSNISAYHRGMMGGSTPNIDRIASEGIMFTDYYAQQSCTAGRASFILGQNPFRTGLLTIGMPGSPQGIQAKDPTIAELLNRWVMRLRRSAKTTWVIATSFSRRYMALMSSTATFTT